MNNFRDSITRYTTSSSVISPVANSRGSEMLLLLRPRVRPVRLAESALGAAAATAAAVSAWKACSRDCLEKDERGLFASRFSAAVLWAGFSSSLPIMTSAFESPIIVSQLD
ncbi:hypothetical protein EIN_029550 [Entamoeba invadens IP1]|uniref:Uncharacterized protein n=1 Tax=Entamoeba invadens IP1 TaxID=370355 RepID=L7FNJ7_ENTIV|nr:hypothetical protein EIN_029550 [Entamoeba invadens IP1]ELP91830.1 hypothetical protein EIN_029550 [Entamoeba invadens IP1]|eukprot:XP_004258601.1 hypothetical protein EIN_029550 [Entamoeba invadens IP1]